MKKLIGDVFDNEIFRLPADDKCLTYRRKIGDNGLPLGNTFTQVQIINDQIIPTAIERDLPPKEEAVVVLTTPPNWVIEANGWDHACIKYNGKTIIETSFREPSMYTVLYTNGIDDFLNKLFRVQTARQ